MANANDEVAATESELIELYNLYRDCSLNIRYFGFRLSMVQRHSFCLQFAVALGASTTVLGNLTSAFSWAAIWVVPFITLSSAVVALAVPLLKLDDRIAHYSRLLHGFSELFFEVKGLVDQIRREGVATNEHIAVGTMLFERYARLNSLDEANPDRTLIAKFQDEVDRAIPPESLWMPR